MFVKSALTAAIALAALAGAAQTAIAQTETASVTVRYADLDLSSPAGAKVMVHRIHAAAESVCGPTVGDALRDQAQHSCVRDLTDRSVARFGNPQVIAANGGSATTTVAMTGR